MIAAPASVELIGVSIGGPACRTSKLVGALFLLFGARKPKRPLDARVEVRRLDALLRSGPPSVANGRATWFTRRGRQVTARGCVAPRRRWVVDDQRGARGVVSEYAHSCSDTERATEEGGSFVVIGDDRMFLNCRDQAQADRYRSCDQIPEGQTTVHRRVAPRTTRAGADWHDATALLEQR